MATTDRWTRIEELFSACIERPPEEREAYLATQPDDPDVLREVRALVEAHARAGGLVDRLAAQAEPLPPGAPALQDVGPYRVLEALGHGGMGSVYLAERADGTLRYRVALKLLRRDLDTPDLRDRFLVERQIVARITHPNITRLLDGGITAEGRPYFVMEHVDGLPIDRYCDERRLTIAQRLELFRTVCAAVQHAHRNLVVHRDIKPANILVTADGTPKLLDFGIAKVLDPEAFPDTPGGRTRTGVRLMTPEYASPEQQRGEAVTTASDVYQLGLLLYDLVAGRHAPVGKPSTGAVSPAVAAARGTTPDRLRRQLAGDLDNITLLALREEPDLRYASVEQLADDIRRYLAGLPVRARPDTWGYVAAKFVRRHRAGVAATAAALALVVTLGAVTAVQARRVARERDRAQQISDLLVGVFRGASPEAGDGGDTLTVIGALDRGTENVRRTLAAQPDLQADMLAVLATVYWDLGQMQTGSALKREALALRVATLGERHPATVVTYVDVAGGLLERGFADSAAPYAERALALTADRRHARTLARARALHASSFVHQIRGDRARARALGDEAVRLYRLHADSGRWHLAGMLLNLGWLHENDGRLDSAAAKMRESIEIRRALPGAPHLTNSLSALAEILLKHGKASEAAPIATEALARAHRLYPAGHRRIGAATNVYARVLAAEGKLVEAEAHYREGIAIFRQAYGDRGLGVGNMLNDLGLFLKDRRGDLPGAERALREAASIFAEQRGPTDGWTAVVLSNLAQTLYPQGRIREAEEILARAIPALETAFPPPDRRLAPHLLHYGVVLHRRGKLTASAALLERVLRLERQLEPGGGRRIARAEAALGACLVDLNRGAEAEPLLLAAHQGLRDTPGGDSFTAIAARALVTLYTRANRPADAARFRLAAR